MDRLQTYQIKGPCLGLCVFTHHFPRGELHHSFLCVISSSLCPPAWEITHSKAQYFPKHSGGGCAFLQAQSSPPPQAELGTEMQILSFVCANPQNGLNFTKSHPGQGQPSDQRAVPSPWYHIHSSNNFGVVGDSSALFSSLKPFFFLSFSP